MVDIIKPTELDIGGSGLGRIITEATWKDLFGGQHDATGRPRRQLNFVESGLDFNSHDSLQQITLNAGVAVIDGLRVDTTVDQATHAITLTGGANSLNRIWLKYTVNISGKVSGYEFVERADTVIEPRAVMLAEVRLGAGGNINERWDRRPRNPRFSYGLYNTTLTSVGEIVVGFRPRLLVLETPSANLFTDVDFLMDWSDYWSSETVPTTSGKIEAYGFDPGAPESGMYLAMA